MVCISVHKTYCTSNLTDSYVIRQPKHDPYVHVVGHGVSQVADVVMAIDQHRLREDHVTGLGG